MTTAGIGTNTGKEFNIISVHKPKPSFRVEFNEFLDILRVDPTVIAAGLPSVASVVAKLLFLNPYGRLGKKVDAAHVIPMGMADDDVSDFFGLNSRKSYGFIRANVVGGGEFFEEGIAVVAAVEKNVVASAADQPDHHRNFDFLAGIAHHKVGEIVLGGGIANRPDGILRRGGRVGTHTEQASENRDDQNALREGSSAVKVMSLSQKMAFRKRQPRAAVVDAR